mmetsp:Transcript_51445/g.102398  ORF Transcript_51445/g.102398 Transcript_51445/m.102398 type:complete len:82 (-) Transcript_51445:1019-1264(-)
MHSHASIAMQAQQCMHSTAYSAMQAPADHLGGHAATAVALSTQGNQSIDQSLGRACGDRLGLLDTRIEVEILQSIKKRAFL